jgi:hypothetical protein
MDIEAAPHGNSPRPRPPSRPPVKARAGIAPRSSPARASGPATDHDATLLVMALEEIQARDAVLEWLLEADLLRACLV